MERIPAGTGKQVQTSQYEFSSCDFHSFPTANISLLPSIQLIDCSVEHDLAPEEVEFEFTHRDGELFGKQSGNLIESVHLETNEYGACYYLNYAPIHGVQDSLGRWCCWNVDSEIPSDVEMLQDELHAIHVVSDGGMVYRASWNYERKPRGLAIILCGLGGMQHSSTVLGKALLDDNWAVAYLFTVLNVPEYSMKIKLENDHPIESAIAIFDSKYCQVIAATKAVRRRMEKQHPILQNAPVALIGISAGALNTPAVYSEMQDEVDAVVLVAGGANMFDIVQDGVFTNWKFTDKDGNKFSREKRIAMNEAYLQTPSRDPYFLAPELPRDNTLIIHAKWDAVVPSKNGDLLWERAGKPERWVYPSGHLGLFATFEWHSKDITHWINAKTNQD